MSKAENTWELIESGDLFSKQKLAKLKAEFEKSSGEEDVLAWLIERKRISDYHRKVFEAGHSGPFRYGEYVVKDRISEGYFKGGFRAVHLDTQHPVILSFVTDEQAAYHWPRLRSMTYATQFFVSPLLVRCFEAEENEDFKFLVFEDFDSVSLASILAKSGQLKPKTACDIIRRVALALQTMHQAGYSHGHISSQHVRVQGGSVVKLFFDPDFYFIPPVKADQNPDPLSLVQVDYAAPELGIPGNRPDELTDIYALGCLFYELLVGKPPFPIGSIKDRIRQHATEKVKPLENLGYDQNLAQFIYFLLAKDRKLRFQTVADVLKQLNEIPDSGNPQPRNPKPLPTQAKFDQYIRAKLAEENLHAQVAPTNLLASTTGNGPERQPDVNPEPQGYSASVKKERDLHSGPASSGQQRMDQSAATPQAFEGSRPNASGLYVTDEENSSSSSFRKRQKTQLKKTLLPIGITLLILAVPALWAYWKFGNQVADKTAQQGNDGEKETDKNKKSEKSESKSNDQGTATASPVNFVEDDQRTLWESPTSGQPVELRLNPPGMRLLLSVRGAELFAKDTESLLVKSLGPEFEKQANLFEDAAGVSWKEVRRLDFSIHDNNVEGQDELLAAFVVEPVDKKQLVYWLAKWGDCQKQETAKGSYYNSSNGWSYYTPDSESITTFLIGPESLVKDVVENGSGLPPVGMPLLLKRTDQDRHLNLIVIPNDLTSPSGVTMFSPTWLKVTRLMTWYLGGEDKIKFAFLSVHFDGEDVYLETGLNPQLDISPVSLAEELRTRIGEAPELVVNYMLDVDADRHWKRLAFEIPDWIKSVATMTRVGVEDKVTLANCWQESSAAHNLLAGLDYTLTFAEGGAVSMPPAVATKKTPQTLEELLTDIRTIEIANDDLNIAVDKIVNEIKDEYPSLPFDFKIVINGNHLMEAGITKNQRLVDFKVEQKELGDILAQFVFKANTDKTSTGPNDPKTMLIWVIHEPEPDKKVVLITTRTAAAREGYKLPKQFVPN